MALKKSFSLILDPWSALIKLMVNYRVEHLTIVYK